MKSWIAPVLALVFVAAAAGFFTLGFASSAFPVCLTNCGGPGDNYTNSPYSPETAGSYPVLTFTVHFVEVEAGEQLLTAIGPGKQSFPLVFATSVTYDGNGCGSWPAWDAGSTDFGLSTFYIVQFSQPVSGLLDNGSFTTGGGTSLYITENNTTPYGEADPLLSYCLGTPTGGTAEKAPGLNTLIWHHTLILLGTPNSNVIEGPVSVTVNLYTQGQWCDGSITGTVSGACASAQGNTQQLVQAIDNGAWSGEASARAVFQSGVASAIVQNPGNLAFNGGQISVTVTTGYGGFTASLLCPQPRTTTNGGGCNGGSTDPRFPTETIPNGQSGYPVTWNVPSGAGQNSSVTGWNTWELVLNNSYLSEQYSPVTIDIYPAAAPGLPVITFTNSGSLYYPQQGDTVTLTIYANASGSSGAVTGITIWAYYLAPNTNPTQEPPCGTAQWITGNCPYGTPLEGSQLSKVGSNAVGTYTFTVDPATGTNSVGILAEGFTGQQQGSPIVPYLLQISPTTCPTQGGPGCPTHASVSTWEVAGPVLLAIMLIVGGALAFLLLPIPMWGRVAALAIPAGLVFVLVLFGPLDPYSSGSWFLPGGLFSPGVR
jgi:hypothetical protein